MHLTAFEKDVVSAASLQLGPVAEVVIRDRGSHFLTDEEFEPFHTLLMDDLVNFLAYFQARNTTALAAVDLTNVRHARDISNLIREIAFHKAPPLPTPNMPSPFVAQPQPSTPPQHLIIPQCQTTGKYAGNFKLDPASGDYVFGCGARFPGYNPAMAHKVLCHGYIHHKYTSGWATDTLKQAGITVWTPQGTMHTPPASPAQDPDPDPKLITVTNLWTPKLNLDLRNLDLLPRQPGRFAAGEQADARFYFIRLLDKGVKIKGKFVWTKFAHRFNWETAYTGDFIVRKLAGDTKEWVGVQKAQGVTNQAWTWAAAQADPTLERTIHKNIYVGDHEDDILEILNDPDRARINYGLWRQECSYCGRNLTDAESRLRGVGPDCWEAKHLPRLAAQGAKP